MPHTSFPSLSKGCVCVCVCVCVCEKETEGQRARQTHRLCVLEAERKGGIHVFRDIHEYLEKVAQVILIRLTYPTEN